MGKNWYILHIYSGNEMKVEEYIDKHLRKDEVGKYIGEIKVPMENVMEMRNGKKRNVRRKFFPGYILVEISLPNLKEEWKRVCGEVVRVQGVKGFVGLGKDEKPVPISNDEVKGILRKMGEIKTMESIVPKVAYTLGESVRIMDGPFVNFNATIEEINYEKGRVKVRVDIFGRSTPVELDFLQVESL